MLIKGLGVSLFIFSLANHAAGVPAVITHPGIQSRYIVRSPAGLRDCRKMSGEEDLRQQVEELKKRVREAEAEKRVAEEENKKMRRGREGVRGGEDVMRGSGAGGLAGRAMGSAMHVGLQGQESMHVGMQGQQGMENDDTILFFERASEHPPTKISDGSRQGTSMAASDDAFPQLSLFGAHKTVKQSTNLVNIISKDETVLARRHTPQVVADHERA